MEVAKQTRKSFCVTTRGVPPAVYPVCVVSCRGRETLAPNWGNHTTTSLPRRGSGTRGWRRDLGPETGVPPSPSPRKDLGPEGLGYPLPPPPPSFVDWQTENITFRYRSNADGNYSWWPGNYERIPKFFGVSQQTSKRARNQCFIQAIFKTRPDIADDV